LLPPIVAAPARNAAPRLVERVLVGGTLERPEARIRIGSGALAGAEFRVSAVGGEVAVQARLLTATVASRKTLAMAVEEIARRMRAARRFR
jgi:hypothetical protein